MPQQPNCILSEYICFTLRKYASQIFTSQETSKKNHLTTDTKKYQKRENPLKRKFNLFLF